MKIICPICQLFLAEVTLITPGEVLVYCSRCAVDRPLPATTNSISAESNSQLDY